MYEVSGKCKERFERMRSLDSVKKALEFIENDQARTIEDQKELVLIEAPTGHEENRAREFAERLKALGLEQVHIDQGGNVISVMKGAGTGPKVLLEGHLDTVFPC